MITKKTIEAQIYAFKKHANQLYDNDVPYTIHLSLVNTFGIKYLYLLPEKYREIVIVALWLHDVREDLGISYNEIKEIFGFEVAEIVYNLTNNDGRTRKEKAINTYGPKTSTNRLSVWAKIMDRLGNVQYGILHDSGMLKKQASELDYMIEILYVPGEFDDAWNELADKLNKPHPSNTENYKYDGMNYYSNARNKVIEKELA
jgi:hypothetical protein